ncbi:putative Homeodomain-like domain-containing protein 10 [Homarus americanus]|uniref:Putative Homeodomain-like domain-containing protein 10 n=1 Tax=Homarus americanus TaxID=6706 RepID=A0A8J5TLC1_HOMAM|nr:putative Homeodomain-like domain-containing protein 10 [Homarus americanus]
MDVQARGRGRRAPHTWANRPEVIARRALIVGHHEAGKSINEISRLMGISKPTVRLWIRRCVKEGRLDRDPPALG